MSAEAPIREMQEALAALGAAERPVRRQALSLGAEAIVSEAQVEAPVLTGFLSESHTVQRGFFARDRVRIGATAGYAAAVHETHPTKARWFLNAITTHAARILRGALEIAMRDNAPRPRGQGGAR